MVRYIVFVDRKKLAIKRAGNNLILGVLKCENNLILILKSKKISDVVYPILSIFLVLFIFSYLTLFPVGINLAVTFLKYR